MKQVLNSQRLHNDIQIHPQSVVVSIQAIPKTKVINNNEFLYGISSWLMVNYLNRRPNLSFWEKYYTAKSTTTILV